MSSHWYVQFHSNTTGFILVFFLSILEPSFSDNEEPDFISIIYLFVPPIPLYVIHVCGHPLAHLGTLLTLRHTIPGCPPLTATLLVLARPMPGCPPLPVWALTPGCPFWGYPALALTPMWGSHPGRSLPSSVWALHPASGHCVSLLQWKLPALLCPNSRLQDCVGKGKQGEREGRKRKRRVRSILNSKIWKTLNSVHSIFVSHTNKK